MRRLRAIAGLAAVLACGGCAALEAVWSKLPVLAAPQERAEEAPAQDLAALRLTEAAVRAEAAYTTLARIREAGNPVAAAPVPRLVPPALLKPVTLEWVGPLETVTADLAAHAGYSFEVSGAPPPVPLIVTLKVAGRPLILVLRDAGLQAGKRALVTVDAELGMVRVDWAPGESGEASLTPIGVSG